MPKKLVGAQPKFTMLVANLKGGSDPSRGTSGNPVKARSTFTQQHFVEIPGRGEDVVDPGPGTPGVGVRVGQVDYTTSPVPVNASATVTVANNTFTDAAILQIGSFTLKSGVDYAVAGTATDTATNLAAAIDALPGFSASSALAVVTVTGPTGPGANEMVFEALYEGSVENFTLSPDTGTLASAEPTIGPPTLG